ncbi:hypothetical protein QJS10_CPB21g01482 [Acorus calamus]|uniref:Uncharacterized protein n=1 Tax=Acorus calamus TaxID=4465 RepID=A0AAV9C7V8_ACOCL|nr:hypothetical protein QJS10_CPB21g01482 [Acorus calamus]
MDPLRPVQTSSVGMRDDPGIGGKLEWPELVGVKADVATAQSIPCGQYRIQDCCCNRVWLDYSPDGTVRKVPKVG